MKYPLKICLFVYIFVCLILLFVSNPHLLSLSDSFQQKSMTPKFIVHRFNQTLESETSTIKLSLIGLDHSLRAISSDGNTLWNFYSVQDEALKQDFIKVGGNFFLVATEQGRIYKINKKTGSPVWILNFPDSKLKTIFLLERHFEIEISSIKHGANAPIDKFTFDTETVTKL